MRANRSPRKLKTFLGRVIRDLKRKIADDDFLQTEFAWMVNLASRVRDQERGQRGPGLQPCMRQRLNASARQEVND